jgi:hypothetical protein
MSYRLWYSQLDVYDAMRRLCLLLSELKDNSLVPEKLYIADFFLASPPLLHKTSMPREVRTAFNAIRITKPEKSFFHFPPSQILFKQMEPLQRKALLTLMSKEVISEERGKTGRMQLTEEGRNLMAIKGPHIKTKEEASLLPFLCHQFINIGDDNIGTLRQKSGLRRPM